jgi:uncharacterized protein DUF4402
MRFKIYFAALAATVVTASPAFAQQASATAEARGRVLAPLTLTKAFDLDFGTVSSDPTTAGTVSVDVSVPATPARNFSGGVTLVPSVWQPAEFDGAGEPGRVVDVTLNPPASLSDGNGHTVTVNSMVLDTCNCTATTRTISGAGAFTVYVGGDFAIAANQASGLYTANFDVTADYQ